MEKNTAQNQDQKAFIRLTFLTVIVMLLLALFFTGCSYECDKVQYTYYDQVTVDIDSLRNAVSVEEAQTIGTPGGLYYKDGYVYVNEREHGIHIIDNTDPSNPTPVSFVSIPGNFGLAARQNYLYADSYMDLLVFDISDPRDIKLIDRKQNAFEYLSDPNMVYDSNSDILYTYKERIEITEDCDFDDNDDVWFSEGGGWTDDATIDVAFDEGGSNTGEAGSMARFVVSGDVLFTVDFTAMNVFDVSEPANPNKEGRVDIGWGVETIYPYEDHLFIGTRTGMLIYDYSNPLQPEFVSNYNHANACDPVIVRGDYAYVTLRNGTECETFANQLDIVDISNLSSPQLAKTYEMLNPHGLGIDGQCLFICEGSHGLKSFDIDLNDPTVITEKSFNPNLHAFDVITLPNVLMMVGNDGFYQYETDCSSDFKYLSKIGFGL